jgi:mono/diheme cytochrome c family protein
MLALTACDSGEAASHSENGLRLAKAWCSGCHSVESTDQASDAAPSFSSIAKSSGEDSAWLRAWLSAPHPAMPDMNLTRDEIDDIVAYLASLKAK